MQKLDLRKEHKALYSAKARPSMIDVPEMNFIMIDGKGDPNTSMEYHQAIEALYGASYTLKFKFKKGQKQLDWTVMGLEGLWWAEDMTDFIKMNKDRWLWTMMIMQPAFITEGDLDGAVDALKGKRDNPALPLLRLERFKEGLSAQVMHIGPYRTEGPTIAMLHEFISWEGFKPGGKHHEIYLGDPRRTAPEKLKTILRQPVGQA